MSLAHLFAVPRQSRNVVARLVDREMQRSQRAATLFPNRLAALTRAMRTLWDSRADIATFLRTGEEALAFDLRRRFGLGPPISPAQPVPTDLFQACPAPPAQAATIIIPVFNAFEDVRQLLTALPGTIDASQAVIFVDDGSDDPRIAPLLQEAVEALPSASCLTHARNQGFVAAVNTGLAAAEARRHVILLNTDTRPPKAWVPRLLAPFLDGDDIASVTPLSNNAELLSIPHPGIASDPACLVEKLDDVARQIRSHPVDLPTGIGFCLALNRRFLDRVGGFDPAFGRGYGEEVDWCRKAAAIGGRHVVATNLFVGHRGGASFGAARQAHVAKASRLIAARYPDYPQAARDWAMRDPIGPERLAVSIAWAAATASGPVPVFVAHSLGGGAETALLQELAAAIAVGGSAIVLRAGGPLDWRVEVHGARFSVSGDVAEAGLMHRLLEPLTERHVIYSCAVGAAKPGSVPDTLLRLAKGHRLDLRLHDFFPISPSWNLLGRDGRYRGPPSLEDSDPAHAVAASGGHPPVTHREWRRRWSRVMVEAQEVTAFAPSGRQLIEAAYPEVRGKVSVRPHKIGFLPRAVRKQGRCIGVLGGINKAKGGGVLEALATKTSRRIVVIGEMDGRFRLPPPHIVHGRYRQSEIAALAERYEIGLWFVPSVCPETFSFATHEALATGLPVLSFDLGAQGETLAAAPLGRVTDASPEDAEGVSRAIEAGFSAQIGILSD